MTQTDSRQENSSPDIPDAPLPCPFGRHLSYVTGQYAIMFGYEDLTRVMERILDIWDHLENRGHMDDEAGDMLESLLGHLDQTRAWTGWGGVPGGPFPAISSTH